MPKRLLLFSVKFAVTGGLIYWVVSGIEADRLAQRLDDVSLPFLFGAAALIFFQSALVVTWRWERVVATIDAAVPPWALLKTVIITLFFNQVLPSTIGGDGMRIWLLRGFGRPIGLAFRSVLIDRMLGFSGMLLLGLLGAVYLFATLERAGPAWGLALLSVSGLTLLLASPILARAVSWLPAPRARGMFEALAREVATLLRSGRRLGTLVAASVVGQLAISAAVVLFALDLGVRLDPLGAVAVVPGVMLVSTIPISIAGWGLREGSMVVGLGLLGVHQSDAAVISIGFGLVVLFFGLVGGALWLVRGGPRPGASAPLPAGGARDAARR